MVLKLKKDDIWERLQTNSFWITSTRTALFATVTERLIRYVVMLYINGNQQQKRGVMIEKLEEDGTYSTKFSHINVPPADNVQIPQGSYSIEDPILSCEGGTRLYAKTLETGTSVNLTEVHWDSDI